MAQKIKALEEAGGDFGLLQQQIQNVDYRHGVIVNGYVTSRGLGSFFSSVGTGEYLTYIQAVTPGEKIIIYTDIIYDGYDSLAAFTDGTNPLSDAKKIDSNNLTLKVGYNELTVPENATYIGVTLKFADKLGLPENKIIASYSEYAMAQKIKALEEAGGKIGAEKKAIRIKYDNGIVYIATPWDNTRDLIKEINFDNTESNRNINLLQTYISPNTSFVNQTFIKTCGDDICPAFINGSYIAGNHGWNAAKDITANGHGKTIADVGAIYEDANGVKFTIIQIVSENIVRVCSENRAAFPSYSFVAPVGSLTYISDGVNTNSITPTSVSSVGNLYGCVVPSTKKILIDDNEISERGIYQGNVVALIENYDVMDLPSILTAITSNRPQNGYTEQPTFYLLPGVAKLFNQTIAYKFDRNGTTLVNTTIRAYQELYLHFHGFTQAQVISGNAKLYCPKTLPIQVGGTQYDLRNITNWSVAPSSAIIISPTYWENEESAPDRAIMLNDNAVFGCGYILDRGKLKEPRENLVSNYAMHFSTARKLYPMGICQNPITRMNANEYISAVAYRTYYNKQNKPSARTNYSVVEVDNIIYLYVDYHGTIADYLPIRLDWVGKQIEVIEKNSQCNVYEDVVTGDIRVDSNATANNYGYIVLKLF